MKITKRQIQKIIKEEKARLLNEQEEERVEASEHHWPRVDWTNIEDLVDKWTDQERKSWDTADPSMNPDDMKNIEAKKQWEDQVENASLDLEAELTKRVRKIALMTMKEYTDLLIGGEYL